MKERPIIFKEWSIRGILEGQKTMTRRPVKFKPYADEKFGVYTHECPYGQPGDHLWVRETWDFLPMLGRTTIIHYKADLSQRGLEIPKKFNHLVYEKQKWRPSIHMPRWASRINLEIASIKVERLMDITEEDAQKEGCKYWNCDHPDCGGKHYGPIGSFMEKWDSIYGKDSWNQNPWVWVIEFKKL